MRNALLVIARAIVCILIFTGCPKMPEGVVFVVETPTFSREPGSYSNTIYVKILCTTYGATIRYTTDGTEPTRSAAIYSGQITISRTMTIKAKAYKGGWNASEVASGTFTIMETIAPLTFNPTPGTYDHALDVSIACPDAQATIRYTTNGSNPTESDSIYVGPIHISKTTTIMARAYREGWSPSNILRGVFVIQAAVPTFNPVPGTYTEELNVTMACATQGAVIRYTTDGLDPTESSTVYTVPVYIISTTTLKARAYKGDFNPSEIVSVTYTIQPVAPPTLNPGPGSYLTEQNVRIECATKGAVIYYTTDGSDPSAYSSNYVGPVHIERTTTLRARAYKGDIEPSSIVGGTYTLITATPTLSPNPGVYTNSGDVTIGCITPEATVRYTTDGSDPTESSAVYSGPVHIEKTTILKARAYRDGWEASNIAVGNYTIRAAEPTLDPAPGMYMEEIDVAINCITPEAAIYYTIDGSVPTESSTVYTGPVHIERTTMLKARAYRGEFDPSGITSGTYTLKTVVPTLDPAPGIHTEALDITIESVTPGALIRYTTNGSDPTEFDAIYTAPIHIERSTTIIAKAYKEGWDASGIVGGVYIFRAATPILDPVPGIHTGAQDVTIRCTTPGAMIYYTTDGMDPDSFDMFYTTPVHIDETTTLKARAFVDAWDPSEIAGGNYTIMNIDIDWVHVEGGTFQMGSSESYHSDEYPAHTVTLSSFSISKYEVTNAQYCVFLNDIGVSSDGSYSGSKYKDKYNGTQYIDIDGVHSMIHYNEGQFVSDSGKENYPVTYVNWYGAQSFCEWVGGRLPTEAEWEYAARGGNQSFGYMYAGSDDPDEAAWYRDNSENQNNPLSLGKGSHPVGQKRPNELGLYDMSGNVEEWCWDWYQSDWYKSYNAPDQDPYGPSSGSKRVVRGGSWIDNSHDIRCVDRNSDYPWWDGSVRGGFRCARDY